MTLLANLSSGEYILLTLIKDEDEYKSQMQDLANKYGIDYNILFSKSDEQFLIDINNWAWRNMSDAELYDDDRFISTESFAYRKIIGSSDKTLVALNNPDVVFSPSAMIEKRAIINKIESDQYELKKIKLTKSESYLYYSSLKNRTYWVLGRSKLVFEGDCIEFFKTKEMNSKSKEDCYISMKWMIEDEYFKLYTGLNILEYELDTEDITAWEDTISGVRSPKEK